MLEIMLDVNGWQGLFDFTNGEELPMEGKPYLDLAKKITAEHPYPGDLNPDTVKWTTDTALDVCREYDPQLMLLSYATADIMRINSKIDETEAKRISAEVISEAMRFAKTAGYEPIIISTGSLRPIDKLVVTEDIEGYFHVSADAYLGGVFGATEKDFETVKNLEGVRTETRQEFIDKYNITGDYALERMPDIVLYADDDYALTNTGGRGTTLEMIHRKTASTKIFSEIPDLPDDIFEFRTFVDGLLAQGRRIAVIIAESVDDEDMPEGSKDIKRIRDGICYAEGVPFYYALLNGKPFNAPDMPFIFHNPFLKKFFRDRYPYSYVKTDSYQDPIGFNRDFKTASMGTRSGIFHSACMCDYSFECHCRGLAESGVLAFINGDKLAKD
ncbi:MAG: hypothetical protein IJR10_02630 [Clostridia bacterium]|nr:hypothetical protein [Clostridia bacterium]